MEKENKYNYSAEEQRVPKGMGVDVADLVCIDIQTRAEVGRKRYGERLKSFNGRDSLIDAYEESLDLCMYLRQLIDETH